MVFVTGCDNYWNTLGDNGLNSGILSSTVGSSDGSGDDRLVAEAFGDGIFGSPLQASDDTGFCSAASGIEDFDRDNGCLGAYTDEPSSGSGGAVSTVAVLVSVLFVVSCSPINVLSRSTYRRSCNEICTKDSTLGTNVAWALEFLMGNSNASIDNVDAGSGTSRVIIDVVCESCKLM